MEKEIIQEKERGEINAQNGVIVYGEMLMSARDRLLSCL